MRKMLFWTTIVMLVLTSSSAFALMEPDLANRLSSVTANDKLPVEFFMKAQTNATALDASIEDLPMPQRRARVAQVLQEFSAATQADLLGYLNTQAALGKVDDVQSLWLCNMVACWATKDVIYTAEARSDVEFVVYAKVPVEIGELDLSVPPTLVDGIEPNMVTTNVRGAWKQGYHGEGVVLGVVDTGVWYTHDDLTNHLWQSSAYPNHGFNFASDQYSSGHPGPSTYDTLTPLDYYGHGTHCAGIATADGAYGNGTRDTMGIAPSTALMCVPVDVYLHSPYPDTSMENNTMAGYQFCVSPPRDPTNGADVITTSLGLVSSWLPRRAIFRVAEENILAAGIPHCIAAGNEGPTPRTIRTSADCPPPWPNPVNNPTDHAMSAVITIGATDNSDAIASFSSIGPSDWGSIAPYNDYAYPPGLLDPDVCMPGVNILSTYYGGNRAYTQMSGTSMATPGAAGVVCLMKSKNPRLTPRQIDSILEMHAVRDLGPTGKENTYGAGRLNCSLAVAFTPLPNGLTLWRRIVDDVSGGNGDGIVNPGEAINVPTWIMNIDPVPRTGVTGKIVKRDTSSLFTITDSLKTFGTVGANDSAYTGASGFKFSVMGSARNGDVLPMNLILRDAADSTWVNSFDFTVGTAVLNYAGFTVYDSSGNNNGILDPGENVSMVIAVANVGGGNGYSVQGNLVSSDSRLTITDPDGAYGTILRDSTGHNYSDKYLLSADGGIAPGTSISCTLHLTATGGYAVARAFSIRIGLPATPGVIVATHDTGYCALSVTALGTLGYDEPATPQEGVGFKYPKSAPTGLYYSGMLCGNSEAYMVDHYYGVPASSVQTDWVVEDSLRFYPPTRGDEMIIGSYTDAGHPSPAGLKTTQTSFQSAAPGYDDFVVIIYDYENGGSGALNGMYSGIMTDFDIGTSTDDVARTEAGRRAAYIKQASSGNPTMGMKLLSPTTAANLSVIDHDIYVYPTDTAMNEGMKYRFLNGALSFPSSNRTYDWSVVVSAGPFDLPVGGHQRVAYAMVGGSDSANFLVNCDSAQSWYDHNVGVLEPPRVAVLPRFQLGITPNPFTSATAISYMMPNAGNLSIKVYDINGREVATLLERQAVSGSGVINWNARNVAKGVYFVRASLDDKRVTEKVMLVR